jgi:hypothetical protein
VALVTLITFATEDVTIIALMIIAAMVGEPMPGTEIVIVITIVVLTQIGEAIAAIQIVRNPLVAAEEM